MTSTRNHTSLHESNARLVVLTFVFVTWLALPSPSLAIADPTPDPNSESDSSATDSNDVAQPSNASRRKPSTHRRESKRGGLPPKFRRMLKARTAKGRLKGLQAIRERFLHDPEAIAYVVEVGQDYVSKTSTPDTFLLLLAESLGAAEPTDVARECLLGWLDLAIGKQAKQAEPLENAGTDEQLDPWRLFTFACLRSLQAYDHPNTHRRIETLLDDSADLRLTMLAFDLIGVWRHEPALGKLIERIGTPDYHREYAYRFALLNAIARFDHPQAAAALDEVLPSLTGQLRAFVAMRVQGGPNGQAAFGGGRREITVRQQSLRELKNASGVPSASKLVGDGIDTYRYPTPGEPEQPLRHRYAVPTFFGMPIYADRVTFVVDISGTMGTKVRGGGTRLDLAKRELIGAIRKLKPNQAFRIIGFHSQVIPLSSSLLDATLDNKEQTISSLAYVFSGSGTNLHGGIVAGMLDAGQPEQIILLSDGQPTRGELTGTDEILRAVDYHNLFRRIMISTISIDTSSTLMQEMARRNAGSHRLVK